VTRRGRASKSARQAGVQGLRFWDLQNTIITESAGLCWGPLDADTGASQRGPGGAAVACCLRIQTCNGREDPPAAGLPMYFAGMEQEIPPGLLSD
jgi:hypothetical protein